MTSSAKKKKEKKKDFQKAKLKVGKTRPKNTNATDTSFAAKSVVFKQQNLTESGRDGAALFNHNLSLLTSKTETQRRDALAYLTTICSLEKPQNLPQPPSVIISKAQPLVLDGSSQVRQQLLKLLRSLPPGELGSLDQLSLYTRAGLSHLSSEIKLSSLDIMNWLLDTSGEAIVSSAGGWLKTLRTFQNLLSWHGKRGTSKSSDKWSNLQSATNMGSSKLRVHQLTTLARFLTIALTRPSHEEERKKAAGMAARLFPLWHTDAHMLPNKSNPFGYLNLFGPPRDAESELYEEPEERATVLEEHGLLDAFKHGVVEAKKEGGEVGRAASLVEKALKLAEDG